MIFYKKLKNNWLFFQNKSKQNFHGNLPDKASTNNDSQHEEPVKVISTPS